MCGEGGLNKNSSSFTGVSLIGIGAGKEILLQKALTLMLKAVASKEGAIEEDDTGEGLELLSCKSKVVSCFIQAPVSQCFLRALKIKRGKEIPLLD